MQNIDLICIGKMNAKYFAEGVAEYQKRLAAFAAFRILELPEEKIEEKNASDAVVKKALDKEGKAIKTCSFDKVHLVIGKKTIYTGPLYTYKNGMSFSISEPTMPKSDYGKIFQ